MEFFYYDLSKAGSFGGVRALALTSNVGEIEVRKWLSAMAAYTLHKHARLRFRK